MSGKCQGILGNCGLCQGILTVACVVSFKIRENAYFAIWNFKIFSGVTPPNPHNKLLTLKTLLMPPRVLARKRIRCRGGGADQITCLLLCTTCQGIFRQTAWNVREMSGNFVLKIWWEPCYSRGQCSPNKGCWIKRYGGDVGCTGIASNRACQADRSSKRSDWSGQTVSATRW